jgi:enoyl-CoA hydratase/carnithine racemase
MGYRQIQVKRDGSVLRITLDRPARRNALSGRMVSELCHALEAARFDEATRVVVLGATGPIFCAGGDLEEMGAGSTDALEDDEEIAPRTFVHLNLAFARIGKPTIAMVGGPALAGGLGLVAACDLVIAAEEAQFGTPEINVGLWPMMVMASLFRCVSRKVGLRLLLTGERISAEEAARIGLCSEVVPAAKLEARTQALAQALAAKSPTAMRLGLEAYRAIEGMDLEPAFDYLERQLAEVLASEDAQEGIRAFLEKRTPVFRGC